jgi:ubiquinone/menaquinone biosynthesis C-methylase UbiE
MRWDEFTHADSRVYRLKSQYLMPGLRRLARLTPYSDPGRGEIFRQAMHTVWKEYIRGASVLDVGCGTGAQLREFLRAYGAASCVGAEPSYGMIAGGLSAAPRVRFVQATARYLPFRDRSFDIVQSQAMFHHIAPDLRVPCLREQLRVTRRYVVVIDQPGLGSSGVVSRLHRAYYTCVDGSYYRPTPEEWRALAESAGAEVVEAFDVGPRVNSRPASLLCASSAVVALSQ